MTERFAPLRRLATIASLVVHVACASIVGEDYHVVAGAGAGGSSSANCPQLAGPALVAVEADGASYCVDSTEVTSADYAAWLETNPDRDAQPEVICGWNTDFTPGGSWPKPFEESTEPVTQIDWCDARAYCAGVGKRLCGAIGGGPHAFGDPNNPITDMWFRACTAGGTRTYPYGSTFDPEACIGGDYGDSPVLAALPVKTATGCVGGVPGLYDIAGNVNEWEDSCDAETGAGDSCRWRGGSYYSLDPDPACSTNEGTPVRTSRSARIGIRCCFDGR
jgi:formylglycine-generating enzyme required for sulfatase activity